MKQVDIIRRAFGVATDADLAAMCGVIPQAVSAWRRKDMIPPRRCWELQQLAEERQIPLPVRLGRFVAPVDEAESEAA